MTARPAAFISLFALWVCAGCGDGGPAQHPAAGTVRFADGAPVAGAVVEFLPTGGGPAARGKTDADGAFTLSTGGEPGAVAGPHRVGVSRTVLMDGMGSHVRHMANRQVVPPRLASPATSGLTETVSDEGENAFLLTVPAD